MNLKSVMLSESSQTRTSTHCKSPFMSNSRKDKSNQEQQKADQWLPRSRGGWRWPGTGRAGTIQGAGSVRSVVTATGTCALVDTRVVRLKLVRFILCKLYLNQGCALKKAGQNFKRKKAAGSQRGLRTTPSRLDSHSARQLRPREEVRPMNSNSTF